MIGLCSSHTSIDILLIILQLFNCILSRLLLKKLIINLFLSPQFLEIDLCMGIDLCMRIVATQGKEFVIVNHYFRVLLSLV